MSRTRGLRSWYGGWNRRGAKDQGDVPIGPGDILGLADRASDGVGSCGWLVSSSGCTWDCTLDAEGRQANKEAANPEPQILFQSI